jgi:protein gp37
MAQNSKIEWTNHTANLWWGCSKIHAGCDNCYAEYLSETRYKKGVWGNDKPRQAVKSVWKDLLIYQRDAAAKNEIHRVFVGSMMDIFEKPMPLLPHNFNGIVYENTGQIRDSFFREIIPYTPNLMFLLLTKRPSNINKYIPEEWLDNPPKNVMFGTSVSDQETADTLIPQLLNVKGKRFLSIEPMLAPVHICNSVRLWQFKTFGSFHSTFFGDKIHWAIVGGESGNNKRPFLADWARTIRDECKTAEVPFFMKQMDKIQPIPDDLMIRQFPEYHDKLLLK